MARKLGAFLGDNRIKQRIQQITEQGEGENSSNCDYVNNLVSTFPQDIKNLRHENLCQGRNSINEGFLHE
ncbi:hypothetical protein SESBI_17678 [Sesbania bispinosa]|nr:hypothetical protein SESBI_17678 [Sesbania bispinosa]